MSKQGTDSNQHSPCLPSGGRAGSGELPATCIRRPWPARHRTRNVWVIMTHKKARLLLLLLCSRDLQSLAAYLFFEPVLWLRTNKLQKCTRRVGASPE